MATLSNYALRLPASLKQSVEQVARDEGTSLNQFIVTAVAEKLSALKTADYFAERAKKGNLAEALALFDRPNGQKLLEGDEFL
ncbi:MAG: toxin-antitoxin system HicB family antitoxin [Methylococcales bacterium]